MFEKLSRFCDLFLEMGVPGYDLLIYRDGKEVFRRYNGYSDLENKIPMNGTERYNIYSCSKVITCTAALQLWEKGLFSLEDRLSDYMPEFAEMTVKAEGGVRKAERPILVRHLFEMTAGFSYVTASPSLIKCRKETEGKCPTREAMRYLAREPLLFEPGERWEYSLCHDVLAALVEVLSGEKFEDYVKKNIFDAVGMSRSSFMLPEEELDTIAQQYRFEQGRPVNVGKRIIPYKIGTEYASGGAGGISTVEDYMRFLEALRTHKLLAPETLTLMQTDRLTESQRSTYWTRATHGYGLGVRCPVGVAPYTDFGWGGAAGAFLAVDTENAISVYFGQHLLMSPVQGLRSMIFRFVKAELLDPADTDNIEAELKKLYDYSLTY